MTINTFINKDYFEKIIERHHRAATMAGLAFP